MPGGERIRVRGYVLVESPATGGQDARARIIAEWNVGLRSREVGDCSKGGCGGKQEGGRRERQRREQARQKGRLVGRVVKKRSLRVDDGGASEQATRRGAVPRLEDRRRSR